MSKSLGNVIDPMDLAEKYGADAFRLSILRQMRLESQEIRYQESRCEEARNFNNKIWNATRYMLALPEGLPPADDAPAAARLTLADRWILTRLRETVVRMGQLLAALRLRERRRNDLAVPLVRVSAIGISKRRKPRKTAKPARPYSRSSGIMRCGCFIPIAPFISEEVWLALPHDGPTIVTATWPDALEIPAFEQMRRDFESARCVRSSACVTCAPSPGCIPRNASRSNRRRTCPSTLTELLALFAAGASSGAPPKAIRSMRRLSALRVRAPHGVLEERYRKEVARLRSEVERGEKKLSNEAFVAKAAAGVVAKEREKLEGYRADLARAEAALRALKEPA